MSRRSQLVNRWQHAARWSAVALALLPAGMLSAAEPMYRTAESQPQIRVATAQPTVAAASGNQASVAQAVIVPQGLPAGTQFILVPVPAPVAQGNGATTIVIPAGQQPSTATTPTSTAAAPALIFAQAPAPVPRAPAAPKPRPEQLQGVNQQVARLTGQAWHLAERNALFSARQKFEEALRIAAQGIDGQIGGNEHALAVEEAFTAFREAEDFAPQKDGVTADRDVARIVQLHRTPVLKNAAAGLPSVQALQKYYQFGLDRLIAGVGSIPAAADALHGLGKVHTFLAREEAPTEELHSARAIAYQQVALDINPQHARAAAELGVLLAMHGQLPEAKQALLRSLRTQPKAETWQNLATVHRRLGELDWANRADYEVSRMSGTNSAVAAGVQWIDSNQFAQQSQPPMPGNMQPNYAPRPAPQAAYAPPPTGYYPR